MAKLLNKALDLAPKYAMCIYRYGMEKGRPAGAKFWNYARVELRPPRVPELKLAVEEGEGLINFFKSGLWKQKSVKDFTLDGVVVVEVLMWFFVGEIIGRRSLIGYKHVKGAYIAAH